MGIGAAVAHRLEAAGAQVFTQGWTPHDAAQARGSDDLEPDIESDFTDPAAPARVVAAARNALGPLDVLGPDDARGRVRGVKGRTRGRDSDDGRWVTGQVIDSEGGFRRWA